MQSARAAFVGLALVLASVITPVEAAAAEGWGWPLEPPEVVNEFDPPENPYGSGHRGVDLAGSVGQTVMAPAAGVVTFAGVIAGRGVVVVGHGDLRSTLEPVAAQVVVGTTVGAGAPVGTLQGFAHHCIAPCLHWGVLRGDTYLDPLDFVGVGPSRLLPWWDDATRNGGPTQTNESSSESVLIPTPRLPPLPMPLPEPAPRDSEVDDAKPFVPGDAAAADLAAPSPPVPADANHLSTRGESSDASGVARSGATPEPRPGGSAGVIAAAVLAVGAGMLVGRLVVTAMRSRR